MKLIKLQPNLKFKPKKPRLHSEAAIDGPEVALLTLSPFPEVVYQPAQETHVTKIHNFLANETHKNTHIPEFKQRNDVKAQTLPIKETSCQVSGSDMESLLGNQTRSAPVQYPNGSKKQQHEIQRNETDMTAMTVETITYPLLKLQPHKLKNDIWGMILLMNPTYHYPPQAS